MPASGLGGAPGTKIRSWSSRSHGPLLRRKKARRARPSGDGIVEQAEQHALGAGPLLPEEEAVHHAAGLDEQRERPPLPLGELREVHGEVHGSVLGLEPSERLRVGKLRGGRGGEGGAGEEEGEGDERCAHGGRV